MSFAPAVNATAHENLVSLIRSVKVADLAKKRIEMQHRLNFALYGHGWGRYHPLWATVYPEVCDRVYFQHDFTVNDGWFPLFSEMMGFDPYNKIISNR